MRTSFRLVFEPGPVHTRVLLFVGQADGTRALAGKLVFRSKEFEEFAGALLVGASVIQAKPEVRVDPATPPRLAAVRGGDDVA